MTFFYSQLLLVMKKHVKCVGHVGHVHNFPSTYIYKYIIYIYIYTGITWYELGINFATSCCSLPWKMDENDQFSFIIYELINTEHSHSEKAH